MATVTTSPGRMRMKCLRSLPGDVGDDLVPIIELDAELRVGKGLHHLALNEKRFFFGHRVSLDLKRQK